MKASKLIGKSEYWCNLQDSNKKKKGNKRSQPSSAVESPEVNTILLRNFDRLFWYYVMCVF